MKVLQLTNALLLLNQAVSCVQEVTANIRSNQTTRLPLIPEYVTTLENTGATKDIFENVTAGDVATAALTQPLLREATSNYSHNETARSTVTLDVTANMTSNQTTHLPLIPKYVTTSENIGAKSDISDNVTAGGVVTAASTQPLPMETTRKYAQHVTAKSTVTLVTKLTSKISAYGGASLPSYTTVAEAVVTQVAPTSNISDLYCKAIVCIDLCKYGYVFDEEGCQTCKCDCPKKIDCPTSCDYQFVVDDYSCITCQCKGNSASRISPSVPAATMLFACLLKASMHRHFFVN